MGKQLDPLEAFYCSLIIFNLLIGNFKCNKLSDDDDDAVDVVIRILLYLK